MSYQTIGVCSLCGGAVTQHTGPWYGVFPPVPTCMSCGAVAAPPQQVIPMERPLYPLPTTGLTDDFRIS